MNEQEFVKYLKKKFAFRFGTGIGDDTSVVKTDDAYQLITKDILVENVHFSLDYFTLPEIALRSIAVNLSDIAAMGGKPEYFYLGLGFPKKLGEDKLCDFFTGLKKGCDRWQVELAGGDFSSAPRLFISITMVGRSQKPVYRHKAQKNDLIGITGLTGPSALGLKLLQKARREPALSRSPFAAKHKEVLPRTSEGLMLSSYVNAMIDTSDGLLIDLGRILAASQKGAVIDYEKLPVSAEMKRLCEEHHFNEYELVLAGGEDFELLFTVSPRREAELRKRKDCFDYYIIGEITGRENELVVKHGEKTIALEDGGYDHFKFS
ncbi:MAG: thiamine-phosphate kinase [Candidatus Aminicenantes bacterium]|nr:thiamine-phosphate kinase [Candidatus Aminicenantes bacterium]